MLARRRIIQPRDHLGDVVGFGDGSHGRVYRETRAAPAVADDPVVLVVSFRLRWQHGAVHALFRTESLLHTPLFAGFPGFVSKLWLAHDEHGIYRGVYQWNATGQAESYVRALWWALRVISTRGSIHYAVLPGLRRDTLLADPRVLGEAGLDEPGAWWRPTRVDRGGT